MNYVAARRYVGALAVAAVMLTACAGPATPPTIVATPTLAPVETPAPTPESTPLGVSASGILGTLPAEPPGTIWVRVSDPSTPFTFEVPSTWGTMATGPWEEGGTNIGVVMAAGTDTSKLSTDFTASGIVIGVSANPTGVTPREVVESQEYSSVCTASTPTVEGSESGVDAAYRTWESCGAAGIGFILQMGIAATGGGLIGIAFQGSRQEDLGYLEHILKSLAPVAGPTVTPPPGQVTPEPGTGQLYTYDLDFCQNQHGQGIAEGNIRNLDSIDHVFRLLVRFYDTNDQLLNDTYSNATPNLHPGEQFHWQAVIPSGLPSTEVVCKVEGVTVVV